MLRMVTPRSPLARIAAAARELTQRSAEHPGRYLQWLPGQHAFLTDPSRYKMARWGNQWGGKSAVGLYEVVCRCLGAHPFLDVRPPPIEAWIICASWSQSVAIQKKLWEALDPRDLVPETEFSELRGFRGKNPAVEFRNGSIIRIKTTNQGGLNLASATIHCALFDEPPSNSRIYTEVTKRLLKTNGYCLMTLTPINAPCGWIETMVEEERMADHHYRFVAENLIPVGQSQPLRLPDGTPCDGDWIARVRQETLSHEAPIVLDGEWETRVEGSVFGAFKVHGDGSHIIERTPGGIDFDLRLGIDHGSGINFSAVAVLVGVERAKPHPRVWVLDEYVSDGETTEDQDALGIAAMLQRSGLKWKDLSKVYGDRPWATKSAAKLNKKSNEKLAKALLRLPPKDLGALGLKPGKPLPVKFQTVKRGAGHGAGSVYIGCDYLHKAMVRDGFRIHRRCERGIDSLAKWDGPTGSEWKHWIDGLRYALDDLAFVRRVPVGVSIYNG